MTLENYNPEDYKDHKYLELTRSTYPNRGIYPNDGISLKKLIELPLEEQLKYSDAICRKYALNPIFLKLMKDQIENSKFERKVEDLNEVGIGNAAFIKKYNENNSFWCKHYNDTVDLIRNSPRTFYDEYYDIYNGAIGNEIRNDIKKEFGNSDDLQVNLKNIFKKYVNDDLIKDK